MIFKKKDIFRKKEKIERKKIPKTEAKDTFAMIIAAFWIVLPYFLAIMVGLLLFVLFIVFIYG